MISCAKQKGIEVAIHSNLSFRKEDEFFRRLVELKLDSLTVSADGATQKTYQKFRIGGDLELVLKNMRRLVQFKRELGSDQPKITWKLIVNRHSEHDIDTGRKIAEDIGVDFALSEMGVGEFILDPDPNQDYEALVSEWVPQNSNVDRSNLVGVRRLPVVPKPCPKLVNGANTDVANMVVSASGNVFPCCYTKDEKWAFGDLNSQSLEEIWNGEKYQSARSLFSNETLDGPKVKTICDHCEAFRQVTKQR